MSYNKNPNIIKLISIKIWKNGPTFRDDDGAAL